MATGQISHGLKLKVKLMKNVPQIALTLLITHLGGKRSGGTDLTSDGSQVHVLNLIGIELGRHGCILGFLNKN